VKARKKGILFEGMEEKNVLVPGPLEDHEEEIRMLAGRGTVFEFLEAYVLKDIEPDPSALESLLKGNIDVATFFDVGSIERLDAVLPGQASLAKVVEPLCVGCVNEETAAVARDRQIRVDLVSREGTMEGLIEAIVDWRKKSRSASQFADILPHQV
jgi:uroporphyrinogen-III synthase